MFTTPAWTDQYCPTKGFPFWQQQTQWCRKDLRLSQQEKIAPESSLTECRHQWKYELEAGATKESGTGIFLELDPKYSAGALLYKETIHSPVMSCPSPKLWVMTVHCFRARWQQSLSCRNAFKNAARQGSFPRCQTVTRVSVAGSKKVRWRVLGHHWPHSVTPLLLTGQ